jgi:hypothetical protein
MPERGATKVLVDRESAIQAGSRVPLDIFPIDRDHSSMVKFSQDDQNYSMVLAYFRQIIRLQLESSHKPGVSTNKPFSRSKDLVHVHTREGPCGRCLELQGRILNPGSPPELIRCQ